MIIDILRHTPTWVFFLFALLVGVGLKLTRATQVSLTRLVAMPLAMGGLSLYSLLQAFGGRPAVIVLWLVVVAAALAVAATLPPRRGVQYSRASATFHVPGSWLPLVLMMTIFFTRYAVAVLLAMQPALHDTTFFMVVVGTLYGLTSGCFVARAVRIGRQAWGASHAAAVVHPA